MWNIEKRYRWFHLQHRDSDTDIEIKQMDTEGENFGVNWEIGVEIYVLVIICIKYIANENLLYSTGNSTECSVIT